MPVKKRSTVKAPRRAVMDRRTFQRLWRVMMAIGTRYRAGGLPRECYEDIQQVIVWMDNARNAER